MRLREVRKIGNSWFIKLDPADVKDFNLDEGNKMDIEDILIINNNKRRINKR